MPEPIYAGGIETIEVLGEQDQQCARCGSSVAWLECWECSGEHDCSEDSCCCLNPADDDRSGCCGTGGSWHCISSREWCTENPMPGREDVKSSALSPEAWED